jgi:hypothetical protein
MRSLLYTQSQFRQFISRRYPLPPWLQCLGLYGCLFFLIKGLLWLTVPGILLFFGLKD